MFRTPQVSVRWREALLAALLLPAVFLGALELHPAGDSHDFLASPQHTQQEVFSCNTSAGQTAHVHAATARELPPCPACLLRVQMRGAHFVAAMALLAVPDPAGRLHAAAAPAIQHRSVDPSDARGPPAS